MLRGSLGLALPTWVQGAPVLRVILITTLVGPLTQLTVNSRREVSRTSKDAD